MARVGVVDGLIAVPCTIVLSKTPTAAHVTRKDTWQQRVNVNRRQQIRLMSLITGFSYCKEGKCTAIELVQMTQDSLL